MSRRFRGTSLEEVMYDVVATAIDDAMRPVLASLARIERSRRAFTVRAAAAELGRSESTVRRMVRDGSLPTVMATADGKPHCILIPGWALEYVRDPVEVEPALQAVPARTRKRAS